MSKLIVLEFDESCVEIREDVRSSEANIDWTLMNSDSKRFHFTSIECMSILSTLSRSDSIWFRFVKDLSIIIDKRQD